MTRFAPSPTGDLHLGGAYVALASWWMARRQGGALVLRVEDIDAPRVVPGSAERILEDLRWLGLDWDQGPLVQSERLPRYARALETLQSQGLVYPCDCSRADIARVASAPHLGEETVYPGICRELDPARPMKRPPAMRLRVPDARVSIHDALAGELSQNLARDIGDFVLHRGDGIYAYQLVVVVDDLEMGITDVVRGIDLLASTPRQIHLAQLLGAAPPRYHHVPLVLDTDGQRLAKRTAGAHLRGLREAGVSPEEVLGELAFGLGLTASPEACSRDEVLRSSAEQLAPHTLRIPARWSARRSG
ncbi:tRNA glutamyl-Q(34) synthetase GluQRS [Pendulispora albinea]|uniref:Glutamyl-Q tRNA(Asp) synthetase n=1 Tax=Pendulispora albinea TaxID=2741071 RepID=A0ABZ2LTX3_9BACT